RRGDFFYRKIQLVQCILQSLFLCGSRVELRLILSDLLIELVYLGILRVNLRLDVVGTCSVRKHRQQHKNRRRYPQALRPGFHTDNISIAALTRESVSSFPRMEPVTNGSGERSAPVSAYLNGQSTAARPSSVAYCQMAFLMAS